MKLRAFNFITFVSLRMSIFTMLKRSRIKEKLNNVEHENFKRHNLKIAHLKNALKQQILT